MIKLDENFVENFNKMRMEKAGQKLTKNQLKEIFKECVGFSLTPAWMKVLQSNNIITSYRLGKRIAYIFCSTPVYKEKLKSMYKDVLEYNKHYVKKRHTGEVEEIQEEIITIDAIQAAIDLLKANVYKVYKPTITFEEV